LRRGSFDTLLAAGAGNRHSSRRFSTDAGVGLKRILSWVAASVVALVVVLGLLVAWNWAQVQRLMAVNSVFHEDRIVSNFLHMDALFFNAPLPLEASTEPLPERPAVVPDLSQWLQERSVTAIVVLKDGAVVHEQYLQGTAADDRRISWSVAKSFLSALFGIVLAEGAVASIDEPVTRYAPALVGTAYDGVSIRDVLTMSSGVRFNEDYFDFHSDINRMGRVLALGRSMDDFAAGLSERERAAGDAWQYVSIDTHVIGMVIRGATGRGIAELMAERLLQPIGMESSPYYLTDGRGTAFVLGGLNMSTRDFARFGQLFLQDGQWQGRQVVPAAWVAESTRPQANTRSGATRYGFQWWIPADGTEGEFLARGIYGQFVYVNRPAGVVIAVNSADRGFSKPGVFVSTVEVFRGIAASLQEAVQEEEFEGEVTAAGP
jgi:CubicO group peptidase (beta-lactamase class C family)